MTLSQQLREQMITNAFATEAMRLEAATNALLGQAADRLDNMEQELAQIDAVLARRSALDNVPDRTTKILLTIQVAAANDPKAELAEALGRVEKTIDFCALTMAQTGNSSFQATLHKIMRLLGEEERRDGGSSSPAGEVAGDRRD